MKKVLLLVISIFVIAVLAACGQKSQEDVVQSLNEKMTEMKSYKAHAKMTLKMGESPQVYDVEIWYKSPDFYRVLLKNEKKEQSQMILRNKDGVYVLTPALNKSFHFESDWPNNSSQAYLYGSLVKDIIEDKNATFKATENEYVFETKTRYQNSKMLPFQEVSLNKKDLAPVSVKIKDPDHNVLVTVDFTEITFNPAIEEKEFDMKTNMTGAHLEIGVLDKEVLADAEQKEFSIRYPEEMEGVSLVEQEEIITDSGQRYILTFEGDRSFTMVAEKATVVETSAATSMNGDLVNLGFTVGAITDYSISWTFEGVDYTIASQNLTREEMVELARSVYAPSIK